MLVAFIASENNGQCRKSESGTGDSSIAVALTFGKIRLDQLSLRWQDSGRIPRHRRSSGNVPGHDRPGAYDCIFTDGHTTKDCRAAANAGAAFDDRGNRPPVVISLQAAFAGRRARHLVIYEGYAVTDKDFVLDRNTFADESVARDFAASPDAGSFLNLDEGADSAFIADFA